MLKLSQVNIYKIDDNKQQELLKDLSKKFEMVSTKEIVKQVNENKLSFEFTLYLYKPDEEKDVSWNWILNEFNQEILKNTPNCRGILLIEIEDRMYVVTFGYYYFVVDKFCDRNFAFKFARKIEYDGVKTTVLTSPSSQKNKTINTYLNYNNLEFDSGESFSKIKAKVKIDEGFSLYNESIEIGNSLKFSITEPLLDKIAELIIHIENIVANKKDIVKIPVFSKVVDEELIKKLDTDLENKIMEEDYPLNFSEVDIFGVNEIFNHNDGNFTLRYRGNEEEIDELTKEQLKKFAEKYEYNLNTILLDIKVVNYKEGNPVRTDSLKCYIEYTDDEERCILVKGEWYKYNDDYLSYLSVSLSEIPVEYNPEFNFIKLEYKKFLDEKYQEEKDYKCYKDFTEKQIRNKIANNYYAEKYYNIMLSEKYGFKLYDRKTEKVGNDKIELMDLYKDKTMFAVKIGKSSGKLCYVVDQSQQAIVSYKHNLIDRMPEIDKVALWIILDRKNKLNIKDGKPDINELDMLLLKNKIDYWKKEVRQLGFKPIIYLNYVINDI